MQGEQYVAGVHVRPLHTCLPSLGCLLSLRMVHIECTDQEFSECLFLKLICMSALLIQVSLVLNDFDQPHCSYGKIYFGGFCAFTAPLLEKKKCLCGLVCAAVDQAWALVPEGLPREAHQSFKHKSCT